jgi:hypothetical protein
LEEPWKEQNKPLDVAVATPGGGEWGRRWWAKETANMTRARSLRLIIDGGASDRVFGLFGHHVL